MNTDIEPRLAPPGAGLPKTELLVARMVFTFRRITSTRDKVNARFKNEREIIARLIRGLGPAEAGRRVLVPRLRGLEDSSRHWSVWMTLDHLRIVHEAVIGVVTALTNGMVPPGTARTAAVKPDPHVDERVIKAYEKSCDSLLATASAATNLKTRLRYAHPWFGPLDAAGWHALAAGHLTIHRAQIERIISGLGNPR